LLIKFLKMKTVVVAGLLAFVSALINSRHVILETSDKDYNDVANKNENTEEGGNPS
jgi:hypothetical protein